MSELSIDSQAARLSAPKVQFDIEPWNSQILSVNLEWQTENIDFACASTMSHEITLQEGLDKFQEKNAQFFSKRPMSEDAKHFLYRHDIAHVLFGCNTTMYGEGIVKVWTTFGTDLGFWQVTSAYNEVSAFNLFRKYSVKHVMQNLFRFLVRIPQTIKRAKQMTKPWVWDNYEPYLDKPISEIREEFNIQVIG